MKLWLLRPAPDVLKRKENNPWRWPYDKAHGFVLRAASEQEARQMAHAKGYDETRDGGAPWLDPALSVCTELTFDGAEEVVMEDVCWG